uniref:Uncharacterized protein n=3 Tax=Moniliophthora roreri TaxID=221103 RepID=A0A0W0F1A9_MONRR
MPFQTSNLFETIILLGLWHASIIAPTTELTLASVIDKADKEMSDTEKPPQNSSSGVIMGWSPADESFEAGELSQDLPDTSNEQEEIVYTRNPRHHYNRSRVLYTIQEEDDRDSRKGLYTIIEEVEGEDEAGGFVQGVYSVDVVDQSEDGEWGEYRFDLSNEGAVDECEIDRDDDEDTCEEDELSESEVESIVALALKLVVPSKSVDELVAADNWDESFDESSLSMSSLLTVEPAWEVSDEDEDLAEVFGKGIHEGSFRMPEPFNFFGGFKYGDGFDFEGVFNEEDPSCEPLQLKTLATQVSCSSEEEEEEDWDKAFDESPAPGTPVSIHSACPDVVSIPFKSATERMEAWETLLSSLDSAE